MRTTPGEVNKMCDLRLILDRYGITQAEVADAAGIPKSQLWEACQGNRVLGPYAIDKIQEYLELNHPEVHQVFMAWCGCRNEYPINEAQSGNLETPLDDVSALTLLASVISEVCEDKVITRDEMQRIDEIESIAISRVVCQCRAWREQLDKCGMVSLK